MTPRSTMRSTLPAAPTRPRLVSRAFVRRREAVRQGTAGADWPGRAPARGRSPRRPCRAARCRCRTSATARTTGTRSRTRTPSTASRVAPHPRLERPRTPRSAKPAPPGYPSNTMIVGCAGVGVQGRRDPADVPPVGGGDERQHPDGRVLGRVQRARHAAPRTPRRPARPRARSTRRPWSSGTAPAGRAGASPSTSPRGQPPQEAGHLGASPRTRRSDTSTRARRSRALRGRGCRSGSPTARASTSPGRRAPRARRAPRGRAR